MRRLLIVSVLTAACMSALPARAASSEQVVVFWTTGLRVQDLLACETLPALCALGREGDVGLLSTLTETRSRNFKALEAAAGVTLRSGVRHEVLENGWVVTAGQPGFDHALPDQVAPVRFEGSAEHLGFRLLSTTPPDVLPRVMGAPGGQSVTDRDARLVMLDAVPGPIRTSVPYGGGQHPKQLAALDVEVGRAMRSGGRVYVVSAVPTRDRNQARIRLGLIARSGDGRPSILTSGTTRQPGVITIADLLPTILADLGKTAPDGIEGRAATTRAQPDPARWIAERDETLVHVATARAPLTRRALTLAIVAVLFAAGIVFAGVGRARPHDAFGFRSVAAAMLLTVAATPIVIYAEGLIPSGSVLASTIVLFGVALVVGFGGRAIFGWRRTLLAIAGASMLVPLVDLLIGSPLAWRSPWAFQIAGGGRFYGVDEGVLGLVLGGAIVTAGILADRGRLGARPWVAIASASVAITFVLSAPFLGSKFGAPLTAVPVAGTLLVAIAGRRLTIKRLIVIGLATVIVTGAMIGLDRLAPANRQSHVARVTEGQTDVAELIARKVAAQIRITLTTIWTRALAVFALALGVLRWRRPDAWHRGLWGHPGLRASVTAAWIGVVAAVVFNDGGVIAAAPLLLFPAVAVLLPLLEPDRLTTARRTTPPG